MKAVFLNASPRKNWNTAQLLHRAEEGAQSVGAETTYYDLYSLNFTGCRSCMLCKVKDGRRCHCFWKDDFSPIVDEVYAADALFMGAPIYFSNPSAHFYSAIERLRFVSLSYDNYTSYFTGKVNVGLIYTMNAPREMYEANYAPRLEDFKRILSVFNGEIRELAACNTLQVADYSKFNMAGFNEENKKLSHETQFPKDLEAAFQMGVDLCSA